LRLGLGLLELVEPHERHPRRHAREPLAHQHDVRAAAVAHDHISEPALVDVESLAVGLEPHPAVQHKPGQLVAGRIRERRRRVETAANLRRVDSQQTHTPERRHVDRVAIEDSANQHGI